MSKQFNSLWEIKEAIKHEKLRLENLSYSTKQWRVLAEECALEVSNITTSGHEWQIRYDGQHLYNRMLSKQIQRMRAEIRMLRYGGNQSCDSDWDSKSIADWHAYIKQMKVEKWSQKSLQRMHERQIDVESMEYFRVRDQLEQLTKDVNNCRQAWIRAQEKADEETLTSTELRGRQRRTLKPVAKIIPIISDLQRRGDECKSRLGNARRNEHPSDAGNQRIGNSEQENPNGGRSNRRSALRHESTRDTVKQRISNLELENTGGGRNGDGGYVRPSKQTGESGNQRTLSSIQENIDGGRSNRCYAWGSEPTSDVGNRRTTQTELGNTDGGRRSSRGNARQSEEVRVNGNQRIPNPES